MSWLMNRIAQALRLTHTSALSRESRKALVARSPVQRDVNLPANRESAEAANRLCARLGSTLQIGSDAPLSSPVPSAIAHAPPARASALAANLRVLAMRFAETETSDAEPMLPRPLKGPPASQPRCISHSEAGSGGISCL